MFYFQEEMKPHATLDETKTVFVIYSALWKPLRKRAFEVVGEWNPDKLRMHVDIFPNTNFGLNGKLLITATEVVSIAYHTLLVSLHELGIFFLALL